MEESSGKDKQVFLKDIEISFANEPKRDPKVEDRIQDLVSGLSPQDTGANPFTVGYFEDPELYFALPDSIRENDQELLEYIKHTGRFNHAIHQERQKRASGDISGLLSEDQTVQETERASGAKRAEETGYKINVDYLPSIDIDPGKVLFFRITQPSDVPVPEFYWTSDYFETIRGLNIEVPPRLRKTAVILVSNLETINKNGGLIQDINDDNGLAVRQVGQRPFDQSSAITRFSHSSHRITQ